MKAKVSVLILLVVLCALVFTGCEPKYTTFNFEKDNYEVTVSDHFTDLQEYLPDLSKELPDFSFEYPNKLEYIGCIAGIAHDEFTWVLADEDIDPIGSSGGFGVYVERIIPFELNPEDLDPGMVKFQPPLPPPRVQILGEMGDFYPTNYRIFGYYQVSGNGTLEITEKPSVSTIDFFERTSWNKPLDTNQRIAVFDYDGFIWVIVQPDKSGDLEKRDAQFSHLINSFMFLE